MKQTIQECRYASEGHGRAVSLVLSCLKQDKPLTEKQRAKFIDVLGDVADGLAITECKLEDALRELKKPVKVTVYKGCVEVTKIPRGIKVVVEDTDVGETSTLVSDKGNVVELSRR